MGIACVPPLGSVHLAVPETVIATGVATNGLAIIEAGTAAGPYAIASANCTAISNRRSRGSIARANANAVP